MKKFLFSLFTIAILGVVAADAPTLVINNRPLAKVNDKTITLIDVLKVLDTELCMHDPKMYEDTTARYQYLMGQWQRGLEDLIEQELVINEFKEKELFEISDGDVREEMLSRFGPNIMTKLDQLHLTYEEAKKMVENDLIVRQMMWYRAYSKALQTITPEAIRIAYKSFLEQFPPKETWKYQMLSIRGSDQSILEKYAQKAFALTKDQNLTFEEISAKLTEEEPSLSVKASNEYSVEDKNLSAIHKDVLKNLQVKEFSKPEKQSSRNNEVVYRIFYLKDHVKEQPKAFEKMAEELKNMLMNKAAEVHRKHYISRLKDQYGYSDEEQQKLIPQGYQPFGLK